MHARHIAAVINKEREGGAGGVARRADLLARACAAERLTGTPSAGAGMSGSPLSGATAATDGAAAFAAAFFDASAACWSSRDSKASGLASSAASARLSEPPSSP